MAIIKFTVGEATIFFCLVKFYQTLIGSQKLFYKADNEQRSTSYDSLLNSETVKLYGNEEYESKRFTHYMDEFQKKEWSSQIAMLGFNLLQSTTLTIGLMTGASNSIPFNLF